MHEVFKMLKLFGDCPNDLLYCGSGTEVLG